MIDSPDVETATALIDGLRHITITDTTRAALLARARHQGVVRAARARHQDATRDLDQALADIGRDEPPGAAVDRIITAGTAAAAVAAARCRIEALPVPDVPADDITATLRQVRSLLEAHRVRRLCHSTGDPEVDGVTATVWAGYVALVEPAWAQLTMIEAGHIEPLDALTVADALLGQTDALRAAYDAVISRPQTPRELHATSWRPASYA
jgi:hypothetical protein